MISDNLLTAAANSYSFDKSTLQFISDSTNQMYEFYKDGKRFILRFSQRPLEEIHQTKAEMDWLYYLAENKINVSLPLLSDNGELVITAEDDNKTYIISAYEALSGMFFDKNNPARWNGKVFYNWGKLTGDLHRLTKDYTPKNDVDVRTEFNGRYALDDNIKKCAPINKIAEDLIAEIMALPKDKDSYGLIHYDLHPWNFLIDGDKINVFDFDDCLYGWFVSDIGVALYHALWWGRKNDAGYDFTDEIIDNFLDGYLSANYLSDFWISKIPLFMKYRQICKFSWFYNPDSDDAHQKERMYNIENDIFFTDRFEYREIGKLRFIGIDAWRTGEDWDDLWARSDEFMPALDVLMSEYAADITDNCAMMHHNGNEVDTENHYLAGRFFKADTPVPDGFDYYDVPTNRAAYAIYTAAKYDGDIGSAYYTTRDRILNDGVGIPYPQAYWHAAVYTNSRPRDGIARFGYMFSIQ